VTENEHRATVPGRHRGGWAGILALAATPAWSELPGPAPEAVIEDKSGAALAWIIVFLPS